MKDIRQCDAVSNDMKVKTAETQLGWAVGRVWCPILKIAFINSSKVQNQITQQPRC